MPGSSRAHRIADQRFRSVPSEPVFCAVNVWHMLAAQADVRTGVPEARARLQSLRPYRHVLPRVADFFVLQTPLLFSGKACSLLESRPVYSAWLGSSSAEMPTMRSTCVRRQASARWDCRRQGCTQ